MVSSRTKKFKNKQGKTSRNHPEMFSVSSPFVRPPLPCSREHVTEVAFTALSVHSFHYFQHILVDMSFWLCALKICLQCIPFVPEASQLVYQLLPCGCEKTPRKSSVWLYFGPQFKSTAHHCGEVMAAGKGHSKVSQKKWKQELSR